MLEVLGLDVSISMIIYLMLSFSFTIGIILMVSQESFMELNKALQREYGVKRRLIPGVEDTQNYFIDRVILKYRVFSGLLITVTAYFLLLIYK